MSDKRIRHLAAAGIGTALAALLIGHAGGASAQPASKKAPAAAAAPAASSWQKTCRTAGFVRKDAAGKDVSKQVRICVTLSEQLDSKTGKPLFSAAIREVEGQDKAFFMLTLPLETLLQPGARAVVVAKDSWAKAQRNEKVDDAKLKPHALTYSLCHPRGCDAEIEATPQLIADLKAGGGVMIYAFDSAGKPVGYALPLAGFEQALAQDIGETYRATIVVPKQ
jgi:invasion protein IalB